MMDDGLAACSSAADGAAFGADAPPPPYELAYKIALLGFWGFVIWVVFK